jgi:Fur family transcriptional regulator, iron response regulator
MENIKEILRSKSLKLTKQRLLVASYLFDGHDKHVTAEDLFKKLNKSKSKISLATVYNTLHEFYKNKLINKLSINSEKIYFDTNISTHHHFYNKEDEVLVDVSNNLKINGLPNPPKGKKIEKIEVLVHLKK